MSEDLSFYDEIVETLSQQTWTDIENVIFASRTPPATRTNVRKGLVLNRRRTWKRLESVGFELHKQEATMLRALATRCNYPARDRCDVAYSAKKL